MNTIALQTIHSLVGAGKEKKVENLLLKHASKGVREYYQVKKIVRDYSLFANKKSHAEKLVITATHPVEEKTITRIKKALNTPKQVKVEVSQDLNLGMGFVAEYNFKRIDASLARVIGDALQNEKLAAVA
jgi:F0F1-type ATP synthase delta subunit